MNLLAFLYSERNVGKLAEKQKDFRKCEFLESAYNLVISGVSEWSELELRRLWIMFLLDQANVWKDNGLHKKLVHTRKQKQKLTVW